MSHSVKTNIDKCVCCNNCVRHCPVYANKVFLDSKNHTKIDILEGKCIECGECVRVCTHNSRHFIDDTIRFLSDISKYDMAIITAPAVLYNFSNHKNLLGWLKSIGVNLVFDISFGADITTWAYLKLYERNSNISVISQPCPAIVNYIEIYEPELISSLAPVHSPTLCAAIYLKKYLKYDGRIAMLSPCIAKKSEFETNNTNGYVSYNVTIAKLKEYIEKNKINLSNYPEVEFDNIESNLGFTFSRPGGLKENVDFYTNSALWIKQTEGVQHVYDYLSKYNKRKKSHKFIPQLVDALNCANGCNCGTAVGHNYSLDDIDYNTNKLKRNFLIQQEQLQCENPDYKNPLFEKFENELTPSDFMRQYTNRYQVNKIKISEEERAKKIEEYYKILKKETEEQKHHNCDSCGFQTCEHFLNSVIEGRTLLNTCFYYSYSILRQQFSEIKDSLNEHLAKTDIKLESIGENQLILNDIARNINLISINASIEASSAGAYGKGFTVVASEIKKLADKSKIVMNATSKTNNEIKEEMNSLKIDLNKVIDKSDKFINDSKK